MSSTTKNAELEVVNSTEAAMERAAQRIRDYDVGMRKAFSHQVAYAFMAGVELNNVKDCLPHGEFEKWVAKNLPMIAKRSRCRYMALAEYLKTKSDRLAHFRPAALTEGGEIPESQRQEICKVVFDVADGKLLTELYRDMELVRDPKPAAYHPAKKLNAKEAHEAKVAMARETARTAIRYLRLLQNAEIGGILPEVDWIPVEDERIKLGEFYRGLRKSLRTATKGESK